MLQKKKKKDYKKQKAAEAEGGSPHATLQTKLGLSRARGPTASLLLQNTIPNTYTYGSITLYFLF
jgi:hypothetical protein